MEELRKKIPFILFINTREVGAFNYMNWRQILELHYSDYVEIGNHSHSHEYLVDENYEFIKNDILKSIEIFKEKLGKNSDFFCLKLQSNLLLGEADSPYLPLLEHYFVLLMG